LNESLNGIVTVCSLDITQQFGSKDMLGELLIAFLGSDRLGGDYLNHIITVVLVQLVARNALQYEVLRELPYEGSVRVLQGWIIKNRVSSAIYRRNTTNLWEQSTKAQFAQEQITIK
jgi:predicted DCC family thiol-disulfide oxidoreductase YuxK